MNRHIGAAEPEPTDVPANRKDISRMAQGSGLNVLGTIVSQGSLFAIMTVLAHRLGRVDVGRYAECYALLTLLGLLSLAGFRAALTRFIAMYLADGDSSRVRGTIHFGLSLTIAGSATIAAALIALSSQVAAAFHDPTLRGAIVLIGVTLPAATFEDAALAATQGWRSQRAYTLIGLILDPGSRLLMTCGFLVAGAGLMGAMWSLAIAAWLGAFLSAIALAKRVRTIAPAPRSVAKRELFDFSIISWGSTLATTGLVWADTLLLGNLSTQESVGSYTVATRLVTLAIFVLTPINAAFVPHIAHLYHVRDRRGMGRIYGAATRWIIRLSMPAFILLLVFPRDLLGFFGPSYRSAAAVTVILAIGQLINAAAGPCGSLLNMTGRVRLSLLDNGAVLILNIVLNLILIPRYNIIGSAIAWSVSLTIANAVKIVQVHHYVGVRGEAAGLTQTFVAAAGATVAGAVVAAFVSGWLAAFLVGGTVVTIVFVALLAAVGVGDDDRDMVKGALRRVSRRAHIPARQAQPVGRHRGLEH